MSKENWEPDEQIWLPGGANYTTEKSPHSIKSDDILVLRAERDDAESEVRALKIKLAQAQASLAAARAQALEVAAQLSDSFAREICMGAPSGDLRHMQAVGAAEVSERIRTLITPSDSTALAKLLAEERLDELKRCWTYVHVTEDISDCGLGHGGDIESCDFESCIHFAARVAELKGGSKSDDTI